MFEGSFSFRGRIGRMRYFLNGLLMALLTIGCVFAAAVLMAQSRHALGGVLVLAVLLLIGIVAVLWFDLSLHARRIRDIGLDPWIVIPGWIALLLADVILAKLVPSLSIGPRHYSTMLGSIVNLAFSLGLLFWPGQSGSDGSGNSVNERAARVFDDPAFPVRPRPASRPGAAPTFGRRGL